MNKANDKVIFSFLIIAFKEFFQIFINEERESVDGNGVS